MEKKKSSLVWKKKTSVGGIYEDGERMEEATKGSRGQEGQSQVGVGPSGYSGGL